MNPRFIITFTKIYGFYQIKRSIAFVLSYILLPLSLLFIFYMVGAESLGISTAFLLNIAIVGGLISIVASTALYTLFDAAYFRLSLKMHDLLVATEITPIDFMLGMTLSEFAYSVPGILLYILLGFFYHVFTFSTLPYLIIILVLLYLSIASLGFALSFIPAHTRNVWGYSGLISFFLTFLPPLFYSYKLLPQFLLYIFMIFPSTPTSVLLQNQYLFNSPPSMLALTVLVLEAIVFVAMARSFTRWRAI